MALGIRTPGLKLVWEADGLEIDLLPLQGLWTEEQYLRLTDQTNRLIEFTEGSVEVLPLLKYWIVHPAEGRISVLRLAGDAYVVHGVFHRGDTATSSLLQGFTVRVDVVCDAE